RKIGEIEQRFPIGEAMLFGGQARRARHLVGRKLFVRATDAENAARPPRLRAPWRPMSAALARAVAAELGMPKASDPSALAMLIENEEEDEESVAPQPPTTTLFHCAGDAWGLILGDLLETLYRVRVEDYDDLYIMMKGAIPAGPLEFTADKVVSHLRGRWRRMESWFDLGRFQRELPLDVRRASVIEAFDVAGFVRAFNGRGMVEVKND
ncbi:MAG: hypothetical protein ACREEM_47145, partial [Blastocatellia bacterium]